jgi:hypothetical protein
LNTAQPQSDEGTTMADSQDKRPRSVSTMVGIGQIVSMLLGFGAVIYSLGVKGEQLERARADMEALSRVVTDLAGAQASSAIADAKDKSAIEDIKRRIDALERRMDRVDR